MNKPLGGRGKKAPYETAVVRVPVDLISAIEDMVESYRISAIKGESLQVSEKSKSVISVIGVTYQEVIQEVFKILRLKKSASESISRLLKFIYDVNISANDLKSGNIDIINNQKSNKS
jgi:thymidylate synthase